MMRDIGYIPSKDSWTPVDKALYGVENLLTLKNKKAEELRFNAIKHSFNHWYTNSEWYHIYCNEFDFTPSKLKSHHDLEKLPLVSHRFFKAYLEGPDFVNWLLNLTIGYYSKPVITKNNSSIDDMIEVLGEEGIMAAFSSGTSGRFSFIPKDHTTYMRSQYCLGKMGISEILSDWYDPSAYAYLCGPNPSKTNMWVGRVVKLMDDVFSDVQYAFDSQITTQIMRISNGDIRGLSDKLLATIMQIMTAMRDIISKIIKWIEKRDKASDKVFIAEAPFLIKRVVEELDNQGKSFDFGKRGAMITGGGWKLHADEMVSNKKFRQDVKNILGIPERNNVDLYTMVESNWHAIQCPEGHYFHMPPSLVFPMVLDENWKPLGFGESGRFAFIDPLANSYPGAIITGDIVTLLEECPVCSRTGPVLKPDVHRATGEEVRGCAEEMRRLLDEQTPELLHDLVCTPDRSRIPLMFLQRDE